VAQRRAFERRRQRRRRNATIATALVIAIAGGGVVFLAFRGGENGGTAASGTPTPSASASPSASPGTQTGTVTPQPAPKQVACGATAPPGAGKPKPQFNQPAQVTKKGVAYDATIQTSCGTVTVKLLSDDAPKTVNSFVFLAKQGYFDGQYVHRIDSSIDVIQAGDPTGSGSGGPGYTIPDELKSKESYAPGVLAMANGGPNTGGSQFFLIYGPKGHLLDDQGSWTIFGQVVRGMDVLKQMAAVPIQDPNAGLSGQQPSLAVYLDNVTIQASKG
jgi:peptidyl-prolyl cis-trans isomerase B (cyclophilin B)